MITSIPFPPPKPRVSLHVLESPLVPDGSTPGTQASLRPERPLTRRELREAEATEARRAELANGAVTDAAAQPSPQPAFEASARRPAAQPSFDELFGLGGGPATAYPSQPAQPVHQPAQAEHQPSQSWQPSQASRPSQPSYPSHPEATDALRPRRGTARPPVPSAEAEPIDHQVDRDSAFGASGTPSTTSNGFDDLFAGLGGVDTDEAPSAREAEPTRGGRGGRAARGAKPTRAERKAAKSGGPKRSGTAPVPTAPRTTAPGATPLGGVTDDFAALIAAAAGAGAGAAPAPTAAPGLPRFDARPVASELGAPVSDAPLESGPAALPGFDTRPAAAASSASSFDARPQSVAPALSGSDGGARPTSIDPARSTLGADAAVVPGDGRAARRASHAPHPGRASGAASRPASVTATRTAPRRSRASTRIASIVAMSFAALLAVATSVPSLSLLSPEDVQAMALESTNVGTQGGQRVEITGGVLAQDVAPREGYETQTIDEYARAAGIRPEATFTNNPAGTIQWPFAVGVHIGDRFGYRNCYGCSSDHGGQDFNPGLGAEIQAIADGTVSNSTDSGGSLGVVMMIDHVIDGQVVTSVYAHMEYDSRRFEVGDTVEVGDVIGSTGDTGMSTGPHLHFEIRLGGIDGTKVDPLEWLYANTN